MNKIIRDLKISKWVSQEYRNWLYDYLTSSYDSLEDDLKPHFEQLNFSIIEFFSRDDSKHKMKTLKAIHELHIQQKKSINTLSHDHIKNELDILNELLFIADWSGYKHGTAIKRDFNKSIQDFRDATNRLFAHTGSRFHDYGFMLVKGLDPRFGMLPAYTNIQDEDLNTAINVLSNFLLKPTREILLEFADHIESLGSSDIHYSINNKEATEIQLKIRKMLFSIASLIGMEATKELKGIGPLITQLIVIAQPEYENLSVRGVNRQIKTAIKLCESHGIPTIGL